MYASVLSLIVALIPVPQDAAVNRSSIHSPREQVVYQKDALQTTRRRLKFVSAELAYETLKLGRYEGVDSLAHDATDNSIVIRGTEAGLKIMNLALDRIDQDPWMGPH